MLMNKNHEKELLENTVKRFVEEELYPHEETVDKHGEVPLEPVSYTHLTLPTKRIV